MAHVLLIDDNDGVREVLASGLRHYGHEVSVAENGKAALRAIDALPALDIVITDVFMDEMDGLETIQELVARGVSVPMIAISGAEGAAGYDPLPVARALGADRIVHKPVGIEALHAIVTDLLGSGRAPPSAGPPAAARRV